MSRKTGSEMSVSEIASALSNVRWEKGGKRERARMGQLLTKARRKIPKAKRSEIARKAAASISPKAASDRAKKAWETKRRKQKSAQSAA